jgi:hypothetical protein
MLRWILTIAVTFAMIGNGFALVQCKTTAAPSVTESHEDLPDCCKNGFCPHHAAQHHVSKPKPQSDDDCICKMTSRDAFNLKMMSPLYATLPVAATTLSDWMPIGSMSQFTSVRLPNSELLPSTPPPKA